MTSMGIDFGGENSSVAVFKDGKVQIIPNDRGNRRTPCYVTFTDGEPQVGDAAKQQMQRQPKNTVYGVRRLMGRTFDDPLLQDDIKKLRYEVNNVKNKPEIEVRGNGPSRQFRPEEICGIILERMRKDAEEFTGENISNAVITVPSDFNEAQRKSVEDAAALAGIHVLRLMNKPTAAATAYSIQTTTSKRDVLVMDIGWQESYAAVLTVDDFIYDVKGRGENQNLGGKDFTDRLFVNCVDQFERRNGVDLRAKASLSEKASFRLRRECEKAKMELSSSVNTSVELENFVEEIDLESHITRKRFEEMCDGLFANIMKMVEKALLDARLTTKEIDEIILVGGSTRIPRIQKMLEEFFKNSKILNTIEPDQVVSHGAAIWAALLSVNPENSVELPPTGENARKSDSVASMGPATGLMKKVRSMKVKSSFQAKNCGELSLNVGDSVQVLRDFEDGWSEGIFGGRVGIFPTNCCETIKQRKSSSKSELETSGARRSRSGDQKSSSTGGKPKKSDSTTSTTTTTTATTSSFSSLETRTVHFMKIKCPHKAENSEELSVKAGDTVQVITEICDGWFRGVCDGNIGIFPMNCCEISTESGYWTTGGTKSGTHLSRTNNTRDRAPVDREIKVSDLEKGRKLGSGAFGTVYIWKHKKTRKEIAGKEVKLSSMEKATDLLQEAMKIRQLSHRNIVTCFSVDTDGTKIYLFMELMKTSVGKLVRRHPLGENRARSYTSDILDGLIYLHGQGIVHKDIKGDNVLVDDRDVAKIADFGISRYYSGGTAILTAGKRIGTVVYMSPEVIKGGKHGRRSDVWAIGCTVYEMMTGYPPFVEFGAQHLTAMFKTTHFEQRDCVKQSNLGTELRYFLLSIFNAVEHRPYAEALKDHDWLKGPMERSD